MSKKQGHWLVRIRTYPDTRFVSLWLIKRDGPADAGVLWGELTATAAQEVVALLGLPVEREASPIRDREPMTPPGCVPVTQQRNLFSGENRDA